MLGELPLCTPRHKAVISRAWVPVMLSVAVLLPMLGAKCFGGRAASAELSDQVLTNNQYIGSAVAACVQLSHAPWLGLVLRATPLVPPCGTLSCLYA